MRTFIFIKNMKMNAKILLLLFIGLLLLATDGFYVLAAPTEYEWPGGAKPLPEKPKPPLRDGGVMPVEPRERPINPKLPPAPEDRFVLPVVKKLFPKLDAKLNVIIEDEKGSGRFEWNNIKLSEVINRIQAQADINIAISLDEELKQTISLRGTNVTARKILDWVCRLFWVKYARTSDRGIWIDPQYTWLKLNPFKVTNHSIRGVFGDLKGRHIQTLLENAVRPLIFFQNVKLIVIPDNKSIIVNLPPVGHSRISKVIGELRERVVQGDEPEIEVTPEPKKAEWVDNSLNQEFICRFRTPTDLRDLIFEIGAITQTNINFDQRKFFSRPFPKVTLDLGRVTLKRAVEELLKVTPLEDYEVHADRDIWIYDRKVSVPNGWSEESVWARAEVRSYYLRGLAHKMGARVLEEAIRTNVFSAVWDDMAALCEFHEYSGRLVVIHVPEVQEAVARFLKNLKTGEYKKYLLPAEDKPEQ